MVEDGQIKTTVSPFAIREGEIKVFDGKDGYVSVNQIIHKVNLGHISDIHFKILDFINEFEFLTSRQIFQLLTMNNVEIQSQDKLNNKLEQMVKSKILTRYYFSSEEGKGIYRVYCMEKMGKYLLTSREIDCKWQPTDNTKPVALMKKRLAGNQVIIAFIRKVKNFDSYQVKPAITGKTINKTIKGHGKIKLSMAGKSLYLTLECVRREEGWEDRFRDRMKVYVDFYEHFVPMDSGYETKPEIILVCEDEKHMVECLREIVKNKIKIDGQKIYYTTDLRQNADTLDNSLTKFQKNATTGKFEVKNVKFKILQ